jgi:hypothetical protein
VKRLTLAAVALLCCALAGPARADVRVTVTPDSATSEARTANGYTLSYTADAPAQIQPWFVIPGHGLPCGQPDEYGEPRIGDPDTNFLVTTPGLLVTDRIVTWPDTYHLGAGETLSLHLDVITPVLGGCFYAGASASSADPVIGLARGASIFNDQQTDSLATGGTATCHSEAARRCVVDWWVRNDTPFYVILGMERLGARDGFEYVSSTFARPPRILEHGVNWQWSELIAVPPGGGIINERVVIRRPCGSRQALLRLHVESLDGSLVAGTGDGVPLRMAACA